MPRQSVLVSCFGFVGIILLWSFGTSSREQLPSPTPHRDSMEVIVKRLTGLRPNIEEMMSLTGTAGLTYGVIHHGEVIHTENFGYRDVKNELPMNENTVMQIASLTKSMIAAAIGMLVEDKKMRWDTPIKDILPDWRIQDPVIYNNATIVDCLAHRTGMQMNNYWLESNNNIIIPRKDSMKFLNAVIPVKPFRSQWQYNNLGYELAGHVIERLAGKNWGEVLRERIFDPVGMTRSGTHESFIGTDNVSKPYGALSDGSSVLIGDAQIGDNTFAGAAAGGRSCLNDLLSLTKVWLSSAHHQFRNNVTSTPGSPLKQVGTIMSAQIPTGQTSFHETSYAMGWARVQLPGPMGVIGLNGPWLPGPAGSSTGMPIVGKSSPSELVIYHQGSHPGILAALNLLPGSQSAILVLTNTLSLNDNADWVGQMLLEAYLDVKEKNDYVAITKSTVKSALDWYPRMERELRANRSLDMPRDPQSYVGVFYNKVGTVHIDVAYDGQQLQIAFQGLETEIWSLRPWEADTFTWLPESRDVIASRARFSFQSPEYYKIKFGVSDDGKIDRLTWVHEGWNLPEGETFFKTTGKSDARSESGTSQKPL